MDNKDAKVYLETLQKRSKVSTDSRGSTPQQLPESWTLELFAKFQVIFGHKWITTVSTDTLFALALEEWSERLHGLTRQQIRLGLSRLEGEWVPTPMTFRTLCTGDDGLHNTGAYRAFDRSKAIEHKGDPEKGRAAFDEMRKIVK
jgi:hypothetical protein